MPGRFLLVPSGISSFDMFRPGFFLPLFAASVSLLGAQSLDGTWRSEGYGYVFQIDGPSLAAFQVTARTCLPGFTAKRDNTAIEGRQATFRTGDGNVYFVRAGGAPDHRLLHNDGSASDMRIDRIPSRPAACAEPTPDTPNGNFEVFTRSWAENYISFDLKHADWNGIVERNRSKITDQTTPEALFEVLQGMIQPFGDAHTFIGAGAIKRRFHGFRPGTDRVVAAAGGFEGFRNTMMPKIFGVTERAYLHGPLRPFCNDQLQFGHIDAETGYMRIVSFNNYEKNGDFAAGANALEKALDEIFSDSKLKALVIDVRINLGGDDPYGIAIASRLATKEYLAYTKYARADAVDRDRWTPGDRSMVKPGTRPGFSGPVVELTGPLTVSAGETFTQALMGRQPHVTRIGENTQGVFSDVLVRHMPNGWVFGLPNEVYREEQGKAFDGPGIPPEISVPVFADADIAAGRDPGLEKALEILRGVSAPSR
jgi:hypothetical protein